jgi:hypothetical protein
MPLDHLFDEIAERACSIASSSTEMSLKFFDRLSVALVGRVGRSQASICSGVTATRWK